MFINSFSAITSCDDLESGLVGICSNGTSCLCFVTRGLAIVLAYSWPYRDGALVNNIESHNRGPEHSLASESIHMTIDYMAVIIW